MKSLLIDRELAHPLLLPPRLTLIADSSITPPGRPVFLPDFADRWVAEFYFAIKICRLGKDISLKFAPRYFDSFTVAMRLLPVAMADALRQTGCPDGVVSIFDNALTLGQWQPLADEGEEDSAIVLNLNDSVIEVDKPRFCAAQAVEAVARFCTLKTGDIIMPFRLTPPVTVETGSAFSVATSATSLLQLTIK